jgi:hypothetical protein
MASIIFWKIVPTPEKSVRAYGARFDLGGTYDGLVFFLFALMYLGTTLTLTFPALESPPDGFKHLFNLITWRMKAAAEVVTVVC